MINKDKMHFGLRFYMGETNPASALSKHTASQG